MAVILEVKVCQMPKCLARQVTVWFNLINPDVTPAIAVSPVCAVEMVCKSMLRDKSKQTYTGASTRVSMRIMGM